MLLLLGRLLLLRWLLMLLLLLAGVRRMGRTVLRRDVQRRLARSRVVLLARGLGRLLAVAEVHGLLITTSIQVLLVRVLCAVRGGLIVSMDVVWGIRIGCETHVGQIFWWK